MIRYKKLDHLVITVSNLNKSAKFYEGLGFALVKAQKRYELFAGDFKINLHLKNNELLPKARVVRPGSADICFELSCTLEEFKEEVEAKGYELLVEESVRYGVKGEMRSVYLRDLEGNLLEFCSYL